MRMSDHLVIGQTYTREELNQLMGVPFDCDCPIVAPGHVCEE